MAKLTLNLTHAVANDYQGLASMKARDALQRVVNLLRGSLQGVYLSTTAEVATTRAAGTITMASSSGTVGATINGVAVTVAWATSDTVSAALLATAINASANALVNQHVEATSAAGVVTITAKAAGPTGNAVTLAASGTNVTASGARLTGGSSTTYTF